MTARSESQYNRPANWPSPPAADGATLDRQDGGEPFKVDLEPELRRELSCLAVQAIPEADVWAADPSFNELSPAPAERANIRNYSVKWLESKNFGGPFSVSFQHVEFQNMHAFLSTLEKVALIGLQRAIKVGIESARVKGAAFAERANQIREEIERIRLAAPQKAAALSEEARVFELGFAEKNERLQILLRYADNPKLLLA